ncbi:MAG: GNAT family N-acetyltransferase [Desulfobacterales bacterium]|nr:GNAT family N-acetyltransferase [Desulfobacterales bacterium]
MHIRQASIDDIPVLIDLIRRSFRDVAKRFGLTRENCPTHPSFYTVDRMKLDFGKNIQYFLIEHNGTVVGCTALEKATPDTCYLERLGVLPKKRRNGFGNALVQHVFSEARSLGAKWISIGIIDDDEELKSWYANIGFLKKETKEFKHLPFLVTFMLYEFLNNKGSVIRDRSLKI